MQFGSIRYAKREFLDMQFARLIYGLQIHELVVKVYQCSEVAKLFANTTRKD